MKITMIDPVLIVGAVPIGTTLASELVNAGFKVETVNFVAADRVIGRVDMGSVQSPTLTR
jgi:2-polyprenyl-6-methoxyphenol hydroxylase-like FAD-dependent oxidoreductase